VNPCTTNAKMRSETQAIEKAAEKAVPMQPTMRTAVGTLIAAVICVFVTAALWIIPLSLTGGGPDPSGWGELAVMFSIFPAGLAGVLFVISLIHFIIAFAHPDPR